MLKHITLSNFRSCSSTSIDFPGGLCALIGKNGVGKTNILKGIEWLATWMVNQRSIQLALPGVHQKSDVLSIEAEFALDRKNFIYTLSYPPHLSSLEETLAVGKAG